MKKFLVLALVLAVASLANAAIVSSIQIVKIDASTYGISLPSGMSSTTDASGGYWALIGVSPDSGVLAVPAAMDLSNSYGSAADALPQFFAGKSGVVGEFTAGATGAWSAAAGIFANGFTVQPGATQLQLYTIDDNQTVATLRDSMNLVPEPMTLTLLGLGGLLFARKK